MCHGLVLGRETARTAGLRFANAVAAVLDRRPAGDLAIVAHGAVIGLFVARHNAIEPFGLRDRWGMPSLVVLEWPGFRFRAVIPHLTALDGSQGKRQSLRAPRVIPRP